VFFGSGPKEWSFEKILIIAAVVLLLPLSLYTSTTAPGLTGKMSNPEVAAKRFCGAWKRHDRPAAQRAAPLPAVNQLFRARFTRGAPNWQFRGCEKRRGDYECLYYYEGSGTTMRVTGSQSAGYRVTSLKFIAD
jgi:hypothetical protein